MFCGVLAEVNALQLAGYNEEAINKYEQLQKDIEALRTCGGETSYLAYYSALPRLDQIAQTVEKFQTNLDEAIEEAKTLKSKLGAIPFN